MAEYSNKHYLDNLRLKCFDHHRKQSKEENTPFQNIFSDEELTLKKIFFNTAYGHVHKIFNFELTKSPAVKVQGSISRDT